MRIADLAPDRFEPLSGPARAVTTTLDAQGWRDLSAAIAAGGGRLVALWGDDRREVATGFEIAAAYALDDGMVVARLALTAAQPTYPDISAYFPCADRMQRATADLLGVRPAGAADPRKWLRHGAWPADVHPLRHDVSGQVQYEPVADAYPMVAVEGEGVHEIPVGPVHAGTIEPGHFRFSILGERVLRLEERLGYKHKGIEKRFESMDLASGARLAGRVSGDSTVAHAWAFAMAAESAAAMSPPPRAHWLRALALERERVANHLGDLGFIGNDAGLAFALAQFSRLKEDWLRLNERMFGHRYAMDFVAPGGVAADVPVAVESEARAQVRVLEIEVAQLRTIFAEHAGLQDRLRNCGVVTPDLARRLGLTGLAGRASGQLADLRADCPAPPYDELAVDPAARDDGDVAARVAVRFDEILESLRLIPLVFDRMPGGPVHIPLDPLRARAAGAGRIEGWRGEVFFWLEVGEDGRIRRCHPHDPSWQNWPLLEHAILGNIVPDFPLINKSFNLSYAGVDL